MKKITFIVTLLIAFAATAQNSSKSKALLDEVSSKVKSYENIVIDFTYLLENTAENIQQETRGDVSLKDQKYRLN
jgi:outer membrane lipoprotein-sorting protein